MTRALPKRPLQSDGRVGDASVLVELFQRRTAYWPHAAIEVEGGGIGLLDDVRRDLAPDVAFALIPTAVEIALAQRNADLLECALCLLMDLARPAIRPRSPENSII